MSLRLVQLISGLAIGEHGGGSELYGLRLTEHLHAMGHTATLLSLWEYGTPNERRWRAYLAERGIRSLAACAYQPERLMRFNFLNALRGSLVHLRALRPHVVTTHNEYVDVVGAALRLLTWRPWVRTSHNEREWPTTPRLAALARTVNPLLVTAETGVSAAIVAQLDARPLARRLGRRATLTPNGVDAATVERQRSGHDLRGELGLAADAPLFGTLARLSTQKGVGYLLEAMALVGQELPTAHLVVAGDGELRDELEVRAGQLGLGAAVSFLGGRPDPIDVLASLDAFVLPSLWEGLPTVIIEAMLVGTPVVATDIGGTRDLVRPGQTGRLVPAADPVALAAAMVTLIRQPATAQAMAAAARELAATFSMARTAARFQELSGRRAGRSP